MKKIVLVLITVLLTVSGFAQNTADIGIWGGTSSYWGDVKEVPPVQTFNLNMGGYFRYNFNPRVGMRIMFLTGKLSADGFVEDEPWDFSKNAQDLSMQVEINYLKYIMGERKTPFTPYIMGGIGVMYFPYTYDPVRLAAINPGLPGAIESEESVIAPTIPFGFGIKFSVGERMGIGVEYQLRKLFSDKLDDLDDHLSFKSTTSDGEETIKYTDFLHNNDWPGYLGVHITYKIYLSKQPCPAYDRKYW